MPAVSKKQQRAMAMALAAKQGKMPESKLHPDTRAMMHSMSEKQLKEYASTPRKGLPLIKKAKK